LITGLDSLELSTGVVFAVVVAVVVGVVGVTGVGGISLDFLDTLIIFLMVVGRESLEEEPVSLASVTVDMVPVGVADSDFSSEVDLELVGVAMADGVGIDSVIVGMATPLRVTFRRSLGVASLVAG